MKLVTHTNPDWDAIGSTWLFIRTFPIHLAYADPAVIPLCWYDLGFVKAGETDPTADAVFDTGGELDYQRGRFDHHHLSSGDSATRLVYDAIAVEQDIAYLWPLIELIHQGDLGQAPESNSHGMHAWLRQVRKGKVDQEVMDIGFQYLDLIAADLYEQHEARRVLAEKTTYRSTDGLVVALQDAPIGVTHAAFHNGARLVVFQSTVHLDNGGITNSIGIQRAADHQTPHISNLVESMCNGSEILGPVDSAVVSECLTWFKHPVGFYAGRGSVKSPDDRPFNVTSAQVAKMLDRIWWR